MGWFSSLCSLAYTCLKDENIIVLLVEFTRENKRFLSKKFADVRSSEHAVSHNQQLAMDWRSLLDKKHKSIAFYENEIEIK